MNVIDYEESVRVLSFNISSINRNAQVVPSNPPIDTTMGCAIRLLADGDWQSKGNRLGALLRNNHPPILDIEEIEQIARRSDFPKF